MPANGSLCSGWASLHTRHSAKESGHSLEFNGPLQTREHSLLEIRRRWGLWADSAVDRDFTPLCYTVTCMHLCCAKKPYSCSLEFCLGGFYNKRQLVFCPVLFLQPEHACRLSFTYVCLVLCHFTRNLQQGPTSPRKHSVHQGHHTYCICTMIQYSVTHPSQWIFKYVNWVNKYCISWLKWGSGKFSFVTYKLEWVQDTVYHSTRKEGEVVTCCLTYRGLNST